MLPEGFRFGVATSGAQVEGGFNGPGEPANNWREWERAGRVEPSGIALDFWNRYEDHLDRAVAAGCDAFRLGVEWARCEPAQGEVDDTAFERYGSILAACHERRLQPLVTLHHFTHPAWLGEAFWLDLDSPERFREWASLVAERMGGLCRHWVTLNEINVYALQTWMFGAFPPGRLGGVAEAVRSLDHMLTAHVLAYEAVHAVQPGATVTTNDYQMSLYEADRLLMDVLVARAHGVERDALHAWLVERRATYYARLPEPSRRERALRRTSASAIPLDRAVPRAVAAVYEGPHRRPLDVVALDYYDPVASHHVVLPGRRTSGGRSWLPAPMLWEDTVNPDGLVTYALANLEPGLDLWVVENGLCNRVRRGRAHPRLDGWDRRSYLEANLAAVVDAIDGGAPVGAYYHWTLGDNWEWGSYEPRFGLHGVDRERGLRWSDRDSLGGDAAGTYRRLIDGLRAGDRAVLRR